MTVKRLFAICFIVFCTSIAWFLLGGALSVRSDQTDGRLGAEVLKNRGPVLVQQPPEIFYESLTSANQRRAIVPEATQIKVQLRSEPSAKGLLHYRTYSMAFNAEYRVKNPTPIAQTIYTAFKFPTAEARYDHFSLAFGDKLTDKSPDKGELMESVVVPAGGEVTLKVSYAAAGSNSWTYALQNLKQVKNLNLLMDTNFKDINIPAGAASDNKPRIATETGLRLEWAYEGLIGANAIAMDMPAVTNPGYVAGRMTFFAPVSLLFFFAVLVIVSLRDGVNLHPMNYFFLAAGCFAFQLLFAYLVDLLPINAAFLISASVSLLLVNGYLWRAASAKFATISTVAQFAYMVLFSCSFFVEGLTGITITVGAVITLGLLMAFTARVKWEEAFASRVQPPPLPKVVA